MSKEVGAGGRFEIFLDSEALQIFSPERIMKKALPFEELSKYTVQISEA